LKEERMDRLGSDVRCANDFRKEAEFGLRILLDLPDNGFAERHRGGYLILFDSEEGAALRIWRVGKPPAEKWSTFVRYAMEKSQRLFENPDQQSSWESRLVEAEQFGGAIRAGSRILSFSGLPEHGDEAITLFVALGLGLLDTKEAEKIAEASGNELIWQIVRRE
jgi:hypothetical protein